MRSNRESKLENIINEMYANNMVKEDESLTDEAASTEESDAVERLQEINNTIGDLSTEAEDLVKQYFPQYSSKAESYGVFQWGWSSNPYDTTFNSILEKIEDEINGQEDRTNEESEALEQTGAEESSCNTKREGAHDASDEDKVKCPHCNKIIQASSCGNH